MNELVPSTAAAIIAVKTVVAALKAAEALLSRLCLPAFAELGLYLGDWMSYYRACNIISLTKKLEERLAESRIPEGAHADPRIAHSILEQASWIEDSAVQDMWAGLLESSCTETGDDDSNLIFVNLLGDLTRLQARVLKYACESAKPYLTQAGLIGPGGVRIPFEKLCESVGEKDIQRLDSELDRLRSVGLLDPKAGLSPIEAIAFIAPTPLALRMYVRCQGSRESPVEFFKVSPHPAAPPTIRPVE